MSDDDRCMVKIAFVGAGSVVFTRQLIADLLGFPDLAGTELALHDIDPERLAVAEGTAHRLVRQLGTPATVTASLDRRAALAGADFVINMIQVGGIDATITDLEIPARHGLRQTIGDTTGVGGVFRALRTFPVLEAIIRDMREVCPDALLLNYTNPMAMNVWWASVVAPDIRTYGLCHSVYWTAHDLAELVGLDVAATRYRAAGVNHQAWLLDWTADGQDLYPRRSPPTPGWSAGCASRCSAGSATTPPRPASTPRSTCPGSCARTRRSRGSGSSRCSTSGSARTTSRTSRRPAGCSPPTSTCRSRTAPPSTPRRSSTRS
jgi:hypothetical protein